ncbi:uncharacterized protein CCOS01_04564 [Colletotrichum costaricense]|uniref:Uncharacterized protein n=1 Tax=Colletotrichum costaricense TaxID=1209916 RepID=A0AAJ0E4K0_9PEZI|nr:uncharacterized protein CCOS01_04564 [Colletotrichum costaricense]KAK1532581.1 hypothetical protein CCOS01_04564 [Colletotrichum costaricense]
MRATNFSSPLQHHPPHRGRVRCGTRATRAVNPRIGKKECPINVVLCGWPHSCF